MNKGFKEKIFSIATNCLGSSQFSYRIDGNHVTIQTNIDTLSSSLFFGPLYWNSRVVFYLDGNGLHDLYLPSTGGIFLFTLIDISDQWGHNDFHVERDGSPGYFIISFALDSSILYFFPGAYLHLKYYHTGKESLAQSLQMKELKIQKYPFASDKVTFSITALNVAARIFSDTEQSSMF